MKKMYGSEAEQLEWFTVREKKCVDIVPLRLVKELSLLYKDRSISSPEDDYKLSKQFLGKLDREYLLLCVLTGSPSLPPSMSVILAS